MKYLAALALTLALSYLLPTFLPWWSIALSAFLVAVVIPQKAFKSFQCGFLGVLLLWLITTLAIDIGNDHILSARMASILPLKGSSMLLILLTALLGGIIGGGSALTGFYFRNLIRQKREPLSDSINDI